MQGQKFTYHYAQAAIGQPQFFSEEALQKMVKPPKKMVNAYTYGFNGMEKDDEVKGRGNSYDFGARMYDSRLGRWWSVDSYSSKYPQLSSYAFAGNMPVIAKDPDGNYIYFVTRNSEGNMVIQKVNFETIINYLNSTAKGNELIKEFINNPDRDLYISIGETGGKYGLTIKYWNSSTGNVDSPPMVKIGDNSFMTGLDPLLKDFEGTLVQNPDAEIQFIILDQVLFKDDQAYQNRDEFYIKKASKVLGHELGSHARKPSKSDIDDHKSWGQDHSKNSKDLGTGEAKILNSQINNQKIGNVKQDALKLTERRQDGVFKVDEN